jgi:integrase
MPRKQQFPPPLQHHRASGQARVRYKSRDYYLGAFGSPEAAQAYAKLITQLASGETPDKRTSEKKTELSALPTVSTVIARWLAEESPRYGDNSTEVPQYRYAAQPLIRLYGSLPARDLDCEKLEHVQLAMASGSWRNAKERAAVDAMKRPHGLNRKVLNRQIVRIRTIWRWAERKKLVPPGSYEHLRALPGLRPNDGRVRHPAKRRVAPMTDVNAVVKHLPPVGRVMLLLQWWTGMRSKEVRTMRRDELDTSGAVWVYRPGKHKRSHAGQSREVTIGVRGQAVLGPWLKSHAGEFVFPPSRRRADSRFPIYSREGYAQMIGRASELAGVKIRAYDCRHSAKQRVTRAMGLDFARAYLGQKSLDVTNSYGNALDLASAIETAKRMG